MVSVLEQSLVINSVCCNVLLQQLVSAGAVSRLIGGCVRDAILSKANFDIDIATTLLPTEVVLLLSKNNIKTLSIGIKFGTVSAFLGGEKFEITTLRKDSACDGRHTQVSFTRDFAVDAARRDFTINALSYCPFTHKIYDYLGGIHDLKLSRVVFIGDPQQRIEEDYLRILRFFRFSAYYAKAIDANGLDACIALKDGISNLSKERIKAEFDRLINADSSPLILEYMGNGEILSQIFPWSLNYFALAKAINFVRNVSKLLPDFMLTTTSRYSILLGNQQSLTISELTQYKFSKQEATKILDILGMIKQARLSAVDFLFKKLWLDNIDYLQYLVVFVALDIIHAEYAQELIVKYQSLIAPIFPVDGDDLLRLGLTGQILGCALNRLKTLWIESDFTMTKQQLLESIEFHAK